MLESLGWKYYFALLLLLSHFSHVRLCVTPQMAADQAPLFLGFSRQEYTVWIIKKVDTACLGGTGGVCISAGETGKPPDQWGSKELGQREEGCSHATHRRSGKAS